MTSKVVPLPADDPRSSKPLFTIKEAATFLGVRESTFQTWVHGYARGKPIVLSLPMQHGQPQVPFIGFAEGLVLAAFRKSGVPLQRIRPALQMLDDEVGLQHALASQGLYTDGAEVLFDYAAKHGDPKIGELVVVRKHQKVFVPIVEEYLRRITYANDGWAAQLELPQFGDAHVVVTLSRAFGRPILDHARIRVEDIVDRWTAGDSMAEIAEDFGLDARQVEDVIRAASTPLAA